MNKIDTACISSKFNSICDMHKSCRTCQIVPYREIHKMNHPKYSCRKEFFIKHGEEVIQQANLRAIKAWNDHIDNSNKKD